MTKMIFIRRVTFLYLALSFLQIANACINEISSKYWFGTFIDCRSDPTYTYQIAISKCPAGQVLAEIFDAYLYTNITNEISIRTNNEVRVYYIWINAKFNSFVDKYVWPSNGEIITQYPKTYTWVDNDSGSYNRRTVRWLLSIPNSNSHSHLQAETSSVLGNSILCLNDDLVKRPSNPCSTTDQVNNTYWFGTFISCKRNVYTLDFAKSHCPAGQKLAEVMDAYLYTSIENEIAKRTNNEEMAYSIWVNAKYDHILNKYVWPSNGEIITQYPKTYTWVDNDSASYNRRTVRWLLTIPNSNSYLQAETSSILANSILCLNRNL
jgi:hypothetical protein